MPTTRNLAVLIFEDVDVLDFCGPFEVFSVADPPAFAVLTVAEEAGPALTPGGLSAACDDWAAPQGACRLLTKPVELGLLLSGGPAAPGRRHRATARQRRLASPRE
jgi:hypothetical protein